jgi:hypothetical protein
MRPPGGEVLFDPIGVTLGVDERQEHQKVERLEGQQVVWLRHTGPVSILPKR